MTRLLARVTLATLAALALFGLYLVPVTVTEDLLWAQGHTNVLWLASACFVVGVAALTIVRLAFAVIVALFQAAR